MAKTKRYINREISWLAFNERLLQEANDPTVPLFMRIKFLGIFSNNLDEFFRVRVASLKRVVSVNKEAKNALGFSPKKILREIQKTVVRLQKEFEKIYDKILIELKNHNIFIINERQLTPKQGKMVKQFFHRKVRPLLVPLMISDIPEFPELKDGSIYLAVYLSTTDGTQKTRYALIEIPTDKLSRFLVLERNNGRNYIILLDDVIRYCLTDIFAIFGYDDCRAYTVKITKDAETNIDNDVSKSFLELIHISVKRRRHGQPVRFIHDQEIELNLKQFIINQMKLANEDNIISAGRYHNFKDFMGFPSLDKPELDNPKLQPLRHPAIDPNKSLFKLIKRKDILLHFPYQSYHPVIDFLREAAIDPAVVAIKMTIYRLAKRSNIINALVNARKNGKKVTAILELQARFDEEANIEWAKMLQDTGIWVTHGPQDRKVHAKLCIITRKEGDKLVDYACIGTGNFNEDTAKVYSDLSLFTAQKSITKEVQRVFKLITSRDRPKIKPFKHLLVSPYFLLPQLYGFIDEEIKNAEAGKEAYIFAKLNSLNDEGMIDKLYKASKAGVKVRLIVRGICSLIPGQEGLSENIEAVSIVDKYLEHTRIYQFCNGGEEQIYISSADWMERNLHRRIEVACPIYDPEIRQEIKTIMDFQWRDNSKARFLNHPDGNIYRETNGKALRAQDATYDYYKRKLEGLQ